ncbi:hypothetical protein [Paenibacillus gorillae]|uniref:hypothetical protein n=1 Tax=Paenibacillus gorillae TaxID=1243662 RepID=UPI0004BC58FD|nr:hypothetical protein [Paenibacillus gorillae]
MFKRRFGSVLLVGVLLMSLAAPVSAETVVPPQDLYGLEVISTETFTEVVDGTEITTERTTLNGNVDDLQRIIQERQDSAPQASALYNAIDSNSDGGGMQTFGNPITNTTKTYDATISCNITTLSNMCVGGWLTLSLTHVSTKWTASGRNIITQIVDKNSVKNATVTPKVRISSWGLVGSSTIITETKTFTGPTSTGTTSFPNPGVNWDFNESGVGLLVYVEGQIGGNFSYTYGNTVYSFDRWATEYVER